MLVHVLVLFVIVVHALVRVHVSLCAFVCTVLCHPFLVLTFSVWFVCVCVRVHVRIRVYLLANLFFLLTFAFLCSLCVRLRFYWIISSFLLTLLCFFVCLCLCMCMCMLWFFADFLCLFVCVCMYVFACMCWICSSFFADFSLFVCLCAFAYACACACSAFLLTFSVCLFVFFWVRYLCGCGTSSWPEAAANHSSRFEFPKHSRECLSSRTCLFFVRIY